jgi:hypothetical protein
VHLARDGGRGQPLSVLVTPAQRHESMQLEVPLAAIWMERPGGGRPHKRLERVLNDRGYSFPSCRSLLCAGAASNRVSQKIDG